MTTFEVIPGCDSTTEQWTFSEDFASPSETDAGLPRQILIAVDGVVRGREVAALQYCEPEVTLVSLHLPQDHRIMGTQGQRPGGNE